MNDKGRARVITKVWSVVACVISIVMMSVPLMAQGIYSLADDADGFERVSPNRPFVFPLDNGPHNGYRVEWWYVTANLNGDDGNTYGVQWTLFRTMLAPPGPLSNASTNSSWSSPYVYIGHAAVTSKKTHLAAERFARGGLGQADVGIENGFTAYIDDWKFVATDTTGHGLHQATLTAAADRFSYNLSLETDRPMVLQGEGGYSKKSLGSQASYYYSQPFFEVGGTLTIDGEEVNVTGTAWMDREWSSQLLGKTQSGWDWFSLSLEDERRVMLFRLRDQENGDFYSGTLITPAGTASAINNGDIKIDPVAVRNIRGDRVPVEWRVSIPTIGVEIKTKPLNPDSSMRLAFPYWEGPISFSGTHEGVGYLEMTGYTTR
ncbi:MAG: lipocalin-like domain-containing protein [Pseudomonadota bacterium]